MKSNLLLPSSVENNPVFLRYFIAFSEAFVTMSILVVFFAYKGVTFSEFLFIQAIFSFALFLLEVPSGYLSDRFSRKAMLVAGALTIFIGHFLLLMGYGFWQLTGAEVVLAAGRSLISGTSSAMLYDGLLSIGKEDVYRREEGQMKSWSAYSLAIAGFAGSLLYPIHPNFPQLATCIMMLFAAWFAYRLVEPTVHKFHARESALKEMRAFAHYALRGHEELPWIIFYSGMICGGTMLSTWLTQPYWEAIGIPIWFFGTLFFLQQIVRGYSLAKADVIIRYVGIQKLIPSLLLLLSAGFILQGLINYSFGVLFTFFPAFIFGFAHILALDLINNRVESSMRATVLSVESMFWRLVFGITAPLISFVHSSYNLAAAFLVSGVVWMIVGTIPMYLLWKKKVL